MPDVTNPAVVDQKTLPNNPYPNDPATVSGARDNPLYLGPTNFANIQKQYTPYQIEQATTRDASGNIFWKQGVNISDIPASAPKTAFTAPTTPPPATTSSLPEGGTTPTATVTSTSGSTDAFAKSQSAAASTYLTGIQSTLDNLLAQQQQMQTAAKEAAQNEVTGLKGKLMSIVNGGNQAQQALDATRSLFKVQESIKTLTDIQGKIADASNALNQGLIYEENQPVRMALLTGRSSELKKQGIAQIGALQSAAEVVKGNLTLANAYASDTIAAIKQDNAEKSDALNTLLSLAEKNLVQLSADEKDTINNRMQLLKDEDKRLNDQKDQLLDLATKYPSAFVSGGVTFADTPEQAIKKMSAQMSADERTKFNLDVQSQQAEIAYKKAQAAEASKSGGSGGGSSVLSGSFDSERQAYIDYLFSQNVPLKDVIDQLGGPTKLSQKQLNALQDAWSTYAKPEAKVTASDLVNNYGIDPKENPEYIGMTPSQVATKLKSDNIMKPSVDAQNKIDNMKWYNPFTW